ncbi:MAG: nitrogen fixation protein NifX [Cyanobacteria bacterium J06614_10]
MKIGFATDDSVHVNAHFGSASQIDVYEVTTQGFAFLEHLRFQGNLQEDGNEDKLAPKVQALRDCKIVYVTAIGGSAAGRLIGKNIMPIKIDTATARVQDLLKKMVTMLNGSPPPWLRKALSQQNLFEDDSFEVDMIEEEIAV